jgi:uncharacterized protein
MLYGPLDKLRKGLPLRCEIDSDAPAGTGETVLGPVTGGILLSPAGKTLMAQGYLDVELEMQCVRCGRLHPVNLHIVVERECSLEQIDDPSAYLEEEDLGPMPIANGDDIDLSELVRQLIIINVPPRPLCRPDCRGLCAQCGADLNEGSCGCEAEATDPRLSALRAFLREP